MLLIPSKSGLEAKYGGIKAMSEGLFKKRKSRQTLEYIIKEALGEVRREHNGGIEDGILSQLLALYLDDAIWYQVRKKYQDHLEREIS